MNELPEQDNTKNTQALSVQVDPMVINEYTISIKDEDFGSTGRLNICVIRSDKKLNALNINYSRKVIDELDMLCVDDNGNLITLIPDDNDPLEPTITAKNGGNEL